MFQNAAQKVAAFFSSYGMQYLAKDQTLVQAGREPQGVYYLVSGQVRQVDFSASGSEIVVNIFKPPAFFPMSWAINKTPNAYAFIASSKVLFRQAPAEEAVRFVQQNPDVLYDLLSRVYKGVDGLLGRVVHLMSHNTKQLLLYELILETERFGQRQTDGSTLLALNESELASRIGITRETVNRILHELKAKGLIRINRQGLHIKDSTAIKQELELDTHYRG